MLVLITEPVTLNGQHFGPGVTADVAGEIGQLWIDAGVALPEQIEHTETKTSARKGKRQG